MGRLARGFAWAGIIWCCFLAFWVRSGFAWVPFAVAGALCLAFLVYAARRDKRVDRVLPASLERLAYRSDEAAVAFAWLWRRGQQHRVRILRSDVRCARRHDDTGADQLCVFDGVDDRFLDDQVASRRSYHYSLFVEDGGGVWSDPVLQNVLTYPQAERAALEASSMAGPGRPSTADRAIGSRDRAYRGVDPLTAGGLVVDDVAGLGTDAIFAIAGVFARDKTADGWQEIT
jgi:hypothetical protein